MRAFHEVRTYPEDFKVWCASYGDISFLSHWHKELELIYVRSGHARICVTDHCMTAGPGDLVICDSGDIHYSDSHDLENSIEFIIFDPSLIAGVYEPPCFLSPFVTKAELVEYGIFDVVDGLYGSISSELEQRGSYYREVVKARIREVWFLLMRCLPRGNANKPSLSRRMEQLNDFQQLLSYMEEHFAEDISLADAAARVGFSESHFSKTFKKMTGINFVTYLNMLRVEHAARRLKNSSDRITDVALSCGFDNVRTFNRVFKDVTGSTPSAFAKGGGDAYELAMYTRKTPEKKFVETESRTVVRNRRGTEGAKTEGVRMESRAINEAGGVQAEPPAINKAEDVRVERRVSKEDV